MGEINELKKVQIKFRFTRTAFEIFSFDFLFLSIRQKITLVRNPDTFNVKHPFEGKQADSKQSTKA